MRFAARDGTRHVAALSSRAPRCHVVLEVARAASGIGERHAARVSPAGRTARSNVGSGDRLCVARSNHPVEGL